MKTALIVIDIQKDYFTDGKFPLWNTEEILNNIIKLIEKAQKLNIPIIYIQHISESKGLFFNKNSKGVMLHEKIFEVDKNPVVIQKSYADSFYKTKLKETLEKFEIDELLICGMMTQNCVTHTAISKSAEKYSIKILKDCCTTINKTINLIALNALSTRINLYSYKEIF